MKTKSKLTTQTRLAKALGVSDRTIRRYLKHADAPPITDTEAWVEFLASRGDREETLPVKLKMAIAKQRIRLLKAQADKAEGEEAERCGHVIQMDIVVRLLHLIVGCFSGELDRLAQELPPNLVGRDANQISTELKKEKQLIKMKFHAERDQFLNEVRAKQRAAEKKEGATNL